MGWKASSLLVILAVLAALVSTNGDALNKSCADSSGNIVPHGQTFMPNINDPCHICKCDNSFPILCHTAVCSPPPGCVRIEQIPKECCQYHCYDADGNNLKQPDKNVSATDDGSSAGGEDSITNLSLRLVASTVTSFLVLALLLFMVHRLRQRRLMLAMRRFEAHARQHHGNDDVDPYIPAAFLQIECPPYEDPPPPYSPPKPPHILAEDAPPPYQEIEPDSGSTDQLPLDSNANIFNNNNNNDQSCSNHGAGGGSTSVIDSQDACHGDLVWTEHMEEGRSEAVNSAQGSSSTCVQNVTSPADFPFFGMGAPVESSAGNSNPTRLSLLDIKHPPGTNFDQPYPMLQEFTVEPVTVGQPRPCSAVDVGSVVRNGGRQPGRSCSFSYALSPEQDWPVVTPVNPMSRSYHTSMMDSGVQTHGSYMASLSRRRSKPNSKDSSCRQASCEDAKVAGTQRMITRPSLGGDSAMQQSHRLLQEELRQSLPPLQAGAGDEASCAVPASHKNLITRDQDQSAPPGNIFMPRSQSLNSNFSVCSETGEKRVPPCLEEGGASVLQSDSKYPEHSTPRHHLANISLVDLDRLNNACGRSFQSDFPYRNFNHQNDTATSVDSCAATKADSSYSVRNKLPAVCRQTSRKPVSHPPSQELRPSHFGSRTLPSKIKHKKISLVPLEKSRLSKSKKEKNKSRKKGSSEPQCHEHKEKPLQSVASGNPEDAETAEGWMLQGRATDAPKGRHPPSLSPPVIKQYGFLENLPHAAPAQVVEDNFAEPSRYTEYGSDLWHGANVLVHPYHTLPSQTRLPNASATGLRHLPLVEENGVHHGANTQHLKVRIRPQSAGPTVEAAYEPIAGLSQNCVPRRKVKSIRSKRSRQSYPAVEGDPSADRRMVACMDLNFVEPHQTSDRAPIVETDAAGLGLVLKRQAGDRSISRGAHDYSDTLETHISSYV